MEDAGVDLLGEDAVADERRVRLFGLVGKVDVRLPGKGNPNSHGARPVRPIISMLKWIRTVSLAWKRQWEISSWPTYWSEST